MGIFLADEPRVVVAHEAENAHLTSSGARVSRLPSRLWSGHRAVARSRSEAQDDARCLTSAATRCYRVR